MALWIVNPQGDVITDSAVWHSFDGAPLRVRSLGVERDVYMPYNGTLHVGGSKGSDELSKALEGVCNG